MGMLTTSVRSEERWRGEGYLEEGAGESGFDHVMKKLTLQACVLKRDEAALDSGFVRPWLMETRWRVSKVVLERDRLERTTF
jgi:hypothetical protein